VNLIALNPGPGIPYGTPSDERVAAFQRIVRNSVPCFVRKPRGRDVYAACGQLKRMEGELVELRPVVRAGLSTRVPSHQHGGTPDPR
jgi:23S rRNA (adenine2503-C2)-methyltransferase